VVQQIISALAPAGTVRDKAEVVVGVALVADLDLVPAQVVVKVVVVAEARV
jgi:hypothetical protein